MLAQARITRQRAYASGHGRGPRRTTIAKVTRPAWPSGFGSFAAGAHLGPNNHVVSYLAAIPLPAPQRTSGAASMPGLPSTARPGAPLGYAKRSRLDGKDETMPEAVASAAGPTSQVSSDTFA